MNSKSISVAPPQNLAESEIDKLFPDLGYRVEKTEIKRIKNAFVARPGIVLKRFLLVQNSVHSYRHLLFQIYKVALGSYFLRKRKKLNSAEKYLVIHNVWCNGYYHWICEALPRLWSVKDQLSKLTLILPDNYKGSKIDSLSPFNIKEVVYISREANFWVADLVLPANPRKVYTPDPEVCDAIRLFYIQHIPKKLLEQYNFGPKIYISRLKAKARKVANEPELYPLLEELGFRVICFEDYSFWAQLAIMSQARYLISIHGAGLTNMHFMPAGGSVLELYKERIPKVDYGRLRRSDLPSPCYCRLANALQHKYYVQFCPATDPAIPSGKSNINVNVAAFEQVVREMIGS